MMQNNSVNKGIFHFLDAKIWVSISVYRYENPSGYVTGYIMLILIQYILGNGKGFSLAFSLLHPKEFFTTNFKTTKK